MPGRRIAVLGEMLELGDGHESGHERVGAAAAAIVDRLVVVGGRARQGSRAARGARDWRRRPITEVPDRAAALAALEAELRGGDVVLVKASRGVELDLLVDDLVTALDARRAMTVELIQGLLLAFAIIVILMPPYIRLLRATASPSRFGSRGRKPTSSSTAHRRWAAR